MKGLKLLLAVRKTQQRVAAAELATAKARAARTERALAMLERELEDVNGIPASQGQTDRAPEMMSRQALLPLLTSRKQDLASQHRVEHKQCAHLVDSLLERRLEEQAVNVLLQKAEQGKQREERRRDQSRLDSLYSNANYQQTAHSKED